MSTFAPQEPVWVVKDIAAYLGVKPVTVRTQVRLGRWPAPDGRIGNTPWWRPETITTWRPHDVSSDD